MAVFFPAAATGALWLVGSYSHYLQREAKAQANAANNVPNTPEPFQQAVGDIRSRGAFCDNRTFVSVTEDRDPQGARIFFVDYGNGQRVRQYIDPRILL